MSRPLRIEFGRAQYRVAAGGSDREWLDCCTGPRPEMRRGRLPCIFATSIPTLHIGRSGSISEGFGTSRPARVGAGQRSRQLGIGRSADALRNSRRFYPNLKSNGDRILPELAEVAQGALRRA